MAITYPNSHTKWTNIKIRSNWSQFEHCRETQKEINCQERLTISEIIPGWNTCMFEHCSYAVVWPPGGHI